MPLRCPLLQKWLKWRLNLKGRKTNISTFSASVSLSFSSPSLFSTPIKSLLICFFRNFSRFKSGPGSRKPNMAPVKGGGKSYFEELDVLSRGLDDSPKPQKR